MPSGPAERNNSGGRAWTQKNLERLCGLGDPASGLYISSYRLGASSFEVFSVVNNFNVMEI
jgi:hypothetical protein